MKLFELLNKIDEAASKVYKEQDNYSHSHDKFLIACKSLLVRFLSEKYKEKFIFSSLSYTNTISNSEEIKLVKEIGQHNGFYINHLWEEGSDRLLEKPKLGVYRLTKKQRLNLLFTYFMMDISSKYAISLTQILLNKKHERGIILYTGYEIVSENEKHPKPFKLDFNNDIGYFNAISITENILTKYIENKGEDIKTFFTPFGLKKDEDLRPYAIYLLRYLEIVKLIGSNVYIYFVKPSTIEFKHNLLLSFALTKPINEEDLAYINLIMHRIVSQTEIERGVELKKKSNITAISAVMTRNASHNIGSHVLSRLVDESEFEASKLIEDTQYKPRFISQKTINAKTLIELIKSEYVALNIDKFSKNKKLKNIIKNKICQKFANDQLAIFNSYLKTRQDFLAEIVSTTPQIQNTKSFVNEILKGFDDNRILLNRISGVSNFKFRIETDIIINGDKFEDVDVAISNDLMGQHAFYIIIENIIRNTAKHSGASKDETIIFTIRVRESKLNSSLLQFTVFDNIKIPDEIVDFNVSVDFYNVYYKEWEVQKQAGETFNLASPQKKGDDLFDKLELFINPKEKQETNIKPIPEIKIISGKIKKIDKLIIDQNEKINRSIFSDKSFDLRTEALGLIEMKACAAYLRKIPIAEIEGDKFKLRFDKNDKVEFQKRISNGINETPLIIRAINPLENTGTDKKIRKNALGYRFYIPKPKELLIIDTTGCWKNVIIKNYRSQYVGLEIQEFFRVLKYFENIGILILFTQEVMNDYAYGKELLKKYTFNPNEVYPHEQLLVWTDKLDFVAINEDYAGLSSEEKEKITIKDYLLPKRFIFKKDFIVEFENFKNEEFELENFISAEYNLKNLKIEILRAIVQKKYLQKKISIKDSLLNITNIFPEYNIDESHHGVKNLKPNHYNLIYASRNKPLVDSFHHEISGVDRKMKVNQHFNELNALKHLDDAITNVLVLDERIQEKNNIPYALESKGAENTKSTISIKDLWDNVNVYLPSKSEINLQIKNYEADYDDKIKKIIQEQFITGDRVCKGLDYIIIHLGVIEKILTAQNKDKKDKEDNPEKIELLENILFDLKIKPHIVITSGRAPKNLPSCYSFITFSTTSQYLIENRLKYLLNEVLNASRPKSN